MSISRLLFAVSTIAGVLGPVHCWAAESDSSATPIALYDFSNTAGRHVPDVSGIGSPMDLEIADPKAVRQGKGFLEIRKATSIRTKSKASKLTSAIGRSGAISIEAWLKPANIKQTGPARVITLSQNSVQRNFTLGQEGNKFDVRFRTTATSDNGLPSLSSRTGQASTNVSHVVYTRSANGQAKLFVNGKLSSSKNLGGDLSNWNPNFGFALADEFSGGRPWLGTYFLVAIYNRPLSLGQIASLYKAGKDRQPGQKRVVADTNELLFENRIASLLSKHCLECHDAATRKGGLDLSRKALAFAGGDSGKAIAPGNLSESLLFHSVESDEMPLDRDPLSGEEKATLGRWIQGGAKWTLDFIDPAVYAFDDKSNSIFVQRLTINEYVATVQATLGVDIGAEARELLPPEIRADGFSNTAYNLNVDLSHVAAYAALAERIVKKIDVATFAKRFSKSRRLIDDDARDLIRKMGKWILRGPITDEELAVFRGISTTAMAAGGDFDEAVSYVIQAMIQSPRFVYRIESQVGDGSRWPVNDYELASRLSYILLGASPDEELIAAADKGQLDASNIQQQADRMLSDPRAIERSLHFVSDWLNLDRLGNLRPNKERFPNWNAELARDMRIETTAYFKEIVWDRRLPMSELLRAPVSFITPRLAKHYGIQPRGEGLVKYDLRKLPSRGGILTHGSVLTVGGDEASMVSRGLFVMHDLLRGVVKDPPPCVDTTPVPTRAGLTQRAIAEARIADSNCGGCHSKFEPLAFGLEKFDGLGAFHDQDEYGNGLRDDGQILFPGAEKPLKYQTASQLMDLLATSDRVKESITWKVTQFALGRPLVASDANQVAQIHKASEAGGGTYQSLMKAIVTSDLVLMTKTTAVD